MSNESVPFSHWIFLGVILALVWVLGAEVANSGPLEIEEYGATRGDEGFITENTNLCETNAITPQTIDALNQWSALIARLEAAGGATFLSQEDNILGNTLAQWCSTLAEGYPVIVWTVSGDYALIMWDLSLGFGANPFIIKLSDFHPGGLSL